MGKKWQTFILGGSKITADGDCSHEIKRPLLLQRKVMTSLDNILESRDMTMPTKVHLVKAIVFPVVLYGCESWTIKKTERQRIDAFELWCWRRLESPFDCKIKPVNPKGKQSWIFIGWTDAEAGTPILVHLIRRTDSLEKTLMKERVKAEGEGDNRGWDGWMASLTQCTWVWASFGSWWWTGKPGVLQSMGSQKVRHDWVTELKWTGRFPAFPHGMRSWRMRAMGTWVSETCSIQGTVASLDKPPEHRDAPLLPAHWRTYTKEVRSVQFSHSLVSDSLQPHGLQHARLPCP